MNELKNVIETLFAGLTKDSLGLSNRVTRSKKDVVVLQYTKDSETILVLEDGDTESQSSLTAMPKQCYVNEQHVRLMNDEGKALLSCADARKIKSLSGEPYILLSIWSCNPFATIVLYSAAIRIWNKILPHRNRSSAFDSILVAYDSVNTTPSGLPKIYTCIEEVQNLPLDNDVKKYTTDHRSDVKLPIEDVYLHIAKDLERKRQEEADTTMKISSIFSSQRETSANRSDLLAEGQKSLDEWNKRPKISLIEAQQLASKNHYRY